MILRKKNLGINTRIRARPRESINVIFVDFYAKSVGQSGEVAQLDRAGRISEGTEGRGKQVRKRDATQLINDAQSKVSVRGSGAGHKGSV